MTCRASCTSRSLMALSLVTILPILCAAQTWINADSGNLLDGSKWSGGTAPNAIDATADILSNPTNAGDFALTGSMTVGTFDYLNSQSRSITGLGTLTLQKSSGNPEFNFSGGSLSVAANVAIPTTTKFGVDTSSTISGISAVAASSQNAAPARSHSAEITPTPASRRF